MNEKQMQTLVKEVEKEINRLVTKDNNWLYGYLLAAQDDKCIELPEDWMKLPKQKLVELAAKAYVKCAEKIINGETLPSEMRPLPPMRLQ